jgi:hypothetical protein
MKSVRSTSERYARALVMAGVIAVWSGIVGAAVLQLIAR